MGCQASSGRAAKMLDPLSALTVACSVQQFVEFAGTLISKGRKFYKEGGLPYHKDQVLAAARLSGLAKTVSEALPPEQYGLPSNEETAIRSIARNCNATADEFVKILNKVSADSKNRVWASFRQALKSEWSNKGIASMQAKLTSLSSQIGLHLLVILKYVCCPAFRC